TFGGRRSAVLKDVDVNQILVEDGYQAVPVGEVLPGDVAIYFAQGGTIDHSAAVVSVPPQPGNVPFVVSKWGTNGPEVYHLATTCPDYAVADIRYYRIKP